MKKIAILALIAMLVLVACQGPNAITEASLRDSIFSIEQRLNGKVLIWMTHDDVGVYCTDDPRTISTAWEVFQGPDEPNVIITYRSINTGEGNFLTCSHNSKGTTSYWITGISRLGQ